MREVEEGEFNGILEKTHDSAPGPDGIPYSGWVRSGEVGRQALLHFYRDTFWSLETALLAATLARKSFYRRARKRRIRSWSRERLGFIRGGDLVENVLELEFRALHWHLQRRADQCVVIFYDVAAAFPAAFPSLLHDAMFAVLQEMGLPSHVARAIR
eukprot:4190859-Pyramimonas_sp.AAC.1